MAKKPSGGIDIKDSSIESNDIIGGNKVEIHEHVGSGPVEEIRSEFLYKIKQIVTFLFSLPFICTFFGIIGFIVGYIILVIIYLILGGNCTDCGKAGMVYGMIGAIIGVILGIIVAYKNACEVSR